MYKSVNSLVPAALCLACAAGLTACNNESDVAATTTGTSNIVEENRLADLTEADRDTAAPVTESDARDLRERRSAETRENRPTLDNRAPDTDRTVSSRRDARDARAELTASADPAGADRASVRDASRERREAARAERESAINREPVVVAEPGALDLGIVAAGEKATGTVRLVNTSDTVIRLHDSRTSCGCTVANVPKGHDMQPGESVEVEVSLSTTANRAQRVTKNVTFIFEEHPQVVVPVSAEGITYVTIDPYITDPESNPDGRFVITASDDEPFRLISVTPLLAADLPTEPDVEHEIFISWDQWRELSQPRQVQIAIDHPKAAQVSGIIRAPRAQRAERQLESRSNVRTQEVPLYVLAQRGSVDELLTRIEEGADIETTDPRGDSLLAVAAREGKVDAMRALIEAGANVDSFSIRNGSTPLMNASQSKSLDAVLILLEAGADVNARDTAMGATALSWAALAGDARMVKALLDSGATVEVVSHATGWTPLTCASFGETPDALNLLLEAGADVEATCSIQGATPLMYAVGTGRVENVKSLLKAGANLEAQDSQGHTVLIFGARASGADVATLEALIEAGADVNATDARGLNALDHARARGEDRNRDAVITLLERYIKDDAGE